MNSFARLEKSHETFLHHLCFPLLAPGFRQLPPLLTTGNPNSPLGGVLGDPGTVVLYGGQPQNFAPFAGGRFTLGTDLGQSGLRIETSFFFLESRTQTSSAASNSNGVPLLVMPLYRSELQREGGYTVSLPGTGGVLPDAILGNATFASSMRLWGAEVNPSMTFLERPSLRVDGLFGFRYLDLSESLGIETNSNDLLYLIQTQTEDSFQTRNQFYGAQLGTRAIWGRPDLFLDLATRVALGSTHQVVDVAGITTSQGLGAATPGTFPGGVYAQPTNIGRSSSDHFAVVPQVQVKVVYALCQHLQVYAGYDFLYWSSVVRPGDQIDHAVNLSQSLGQPLTGPATPRPLMERSDFWAQGLSFGVEWKF